MAKKITIEDLAVMVAKGFEKTQEDLAQQTQELKDYSDEQVDKLALIIAETVANPLQRHIEATEVDTDMGVRVWHYQKMIGKSRKNS